MSKDTLDQLGKALARIDRPGAFCVQGTVPALLPGLEVADLGPVGLPLTRSQAQVLKKYCEQAPYGKGQKTLVDTSVRRVWRLTPDRFTLTNPGWTDLVRQMVGKVQEELGLERQKLESHLYDLLLYEPGSFFLPHRDGEKLERMVATLVVVLPSSYEGGELVVRHDGQEQTIAFGRAGERALQSHFAAFYADCEHEIRPVQSGHRLCLVYNLTLAKSKKALSAPRDSEHVERLAPLLRAWSEEAAGKLVVTLDHQYTQGGLAWDALKGVDRVKARVLMEAARRADCKAYLALLTFWESGSAEDSGYDYGRRRRWYRDYDDDEESTGPHKMGEVYDSTLTAEHWCDAEGQGLPIGTLNIDESDLLDPEALRNVDPEEDYEGYTGNAGMTLERWYRHAALILWPAARHFEVLCNRDGREAVPVLCQMVTQWRKTKGAAATLLKAQCLDLGAALVTKWQERPYAHAYHASHGPYPSADLAELNAGKVLPALAALGDVELIGRFLGKVLIKDVSVDPGKSLAAVCQKFGWETFRPQLLAVVQHTNTETVERNVRWLETLCLTRPRRAAGWSELCSALSEGLVAALETVDRPQAQTDWRIQRVNRAEVLAGLTRSLLSTEQHEVLSRLVTYILAQTKNYPLTEVHVAALTALAPWLKKNVKRTSPGLAQWLSSCRQQLEALTDEPPRPPADQRRSADFPCRCEDCTALRRFLQDATAPVYRFKAAEARRRHLQSTVSAGKCDLACLTEHGGSPRTLVCTKNTASYQAQVVKYHEDQKHLATVRALEARLRK